MDYVKDIKNIRSQMSDLNNLLEQKESELMNCVLSKLRKTMVNFDSIEMGNKIYRLFYYSFHDGINDIEIVDDLKLIIFGRPVISSPDLKDYDVKIVTSLSRMIQ